MRRVFFGVIILGAVLTSLGWGCYQEDDVCFCPRGSEYLAPTSPENLVTNLQVAHRRQEINQYAEILAPEFRFYFQDQYANEVGLDFWNRVQDSTGTDGLFRTPLVSEIRIDLTHTGARPPTEPGFDPGTLQIRIDPTFLEVDQTDGLTWRIDDDIQDMYFRKGREAAGEDTTRWFLFEWRDLAAPQAVSPDSEAVLPVSWGLIKALYSR